MSIIISCFVFQNWSLRGSCNSTSTPAPGAALSTTTIVPDTTTTATAPMVYQQAGLEKTRFFLTQPSGLFWFFLVFFNPAQWVILFFFGFLGFLGFFYKFAQKREFLGFFKFQVYF
jgi:hypothetical protein